MILSCAQRTFNQYRRPIIIIIVFIVGGAVGWLISHEKDSGALQYANSIHALRITDQRYHFISPLLIVESGESGFKQDAELNDKIESLIKQKTDTQQAEKISVYYRSLKTGRWVDINKDQTYDPASLLKLPLMIAYLKEAENDPTILQKNITFTQAVNQSSHIPFEQGTKLQYGSSHTADELLTDLITESDNGAMDSLLSTVDPITLSETYTDLGIKNPDTTNGSYAISPKTYSLFFRILYNATYLSAAMSEKALDLLSNSTYTAGLVAGLPQNTTIAHKFGEHVDTDPTGQQQTDVELHDCGIVYDPGSPYILCVMTKGTEITNLQHTISDISKLVYDNRAK